MSTLYVDTINEKTLGNGVQIPGHVVQVVNSIDQTPTWPSRYSTTSNSYTQTPHSITITPKYANSKIKIEGQFTFGLDGAGEYFIVEFRRNVSGGSTTSLGQSTGGNSNGGGISSQYFWGTAPILYVDAPSTTSSITYELWGRVNSGGNTFYLGWTSSGYTNNNIVLTATEIAQ
jgi:hypothetical protein